MIDYIRGTVAFSGDSYIILDNNGIGYRITMPSSSIYALGNMDGEVKIHTYMAVKEDDVSLFGFVNAAELEMFKMLITVSGIGPKGAIGILSSITVDELKMAIAAEDSKLIASAKGIGSKTAQKIVVELKGKISREFAAEKGSGAAAAAALSDKATPAREAIDALEALGFSRSSAARAVSQIEGSDTLSASELIGQALRIIE